MELFIATFASAFAGFVDSIVGGGGLISGMATVAKAVNPAIEVVGTAANGKLALELPWHPGLAATLVPFGVQQVKALQPDQIEAFVVATQKAVF